MHVLHFWITKHTLSLRKCIPLGYATCMKFELMRTAAARNGLSTSQPHPLEFPQMASCITEMRAEYMQCWFSTVLPEKKSRITTTIDIWIRMQIYQAWWFIIPPFECQLKTLFFSSSYVVAALWMHRKSPAIRPSAAATDLCLASSSRLMDLSTRSFFVRKFTTQRHRMCLQVHNDHGSALALACCKVNQQSDRKRVNFEYPQNAQFWADHNQNWHTSTR
jgi:hypothetical protein